MHYAVLLQLHVLQLEAAHLRRGDREGEGQGGRRTGREERQRGRGRGTKGQMAAEREEEGRKKEQRDG